MWQVRLYSGTGLNAVNTVDNPAILEDADYIDVPAIDVLQGEHLSSIRIKATREQVKNVDFLRLTDGTDTFFYSVDPFHMTTTDVTELYITPDPVLTAAGIVNGVDNIDFGDGIVERHHVAKNNDNYGAYTEDDPLLVPSKELAMDIEFVFNDLFPLDTQGGVVNIIESTIDLYAMGTATGEALAKTYTDSETGESITIPQTHAVTSSTDANMFFNQTQGRRFNTAGRKYFNGDNEAVRVGLDRARGMGVEGGILNSYILPRSAMLLDGGGTLETDGKFDRISGSYREQQSGLTFEFANPQNKRVLYGGLCEYEIFSVASGVSMSYRPEAIRDGNASAPTFCAVHDVRANGRPYYRTKYYRGVDITTIADGKFLANAVAGAEWAKAPLQYTGISGSTLQELKYRTNREIAKSNFDQSMSEIDRELGSTTGGAIGNIVSSTAQGAIGGAVAGGGVPGALVGGGLGLLGGILGAGAEIFEGESAAERKRANLQRQYGLQASKELQEFLINTTVTAPQLHFPASETLRDYIGNGICVVRYRPADSDIAKLDKILNMYGYKDTSAIDTAYFTNRSKFNYVLIRGLSVVDKRIPLWLREGLAAQLGAGVRIWHQLPDTAAYTDGTNV